MQQFSHFSQNLAAGQDIEILLPDALEHKQKNHVAQPAEKNTYNRSTDPAQNGA